MSEIVRNTSSRREFLSTSSRVAAASVLAGMAVPKVHAAEDNTLRIALVGCGGRGTGTINDAAAAQFGPVRLVAMADIFANRLKESYDQLQQACPEVIDVPQERQFVGFDAYKSAMDCLRPGDLVILATPLVFRWVHFGYAIQKGLHVFMEKPLTADGPTSRRMLELGKAAQAKNLKVGVGLMSRHSRHLQQLAAQVQDGLLGDIITMRAYRMTSPVGSLFSEKWPGTPSELLWQLQRFHSFLWASGGIFNDAYVHVVDHCCWIKNAYPVKAQSLGGRHYRQNANGELCVDQNFDSYAVEYTFDDGSKLFLDGRFMPGCHQIYSSYAHGSKGVAILSKSGDCGFPSSIHRGQDPSHKNLLWESKVPQEQNNPYTNEWSDLLEAIRQDKPYSEVEYGVKSSLVCSMGRRAAHTGVEVTFEEMLNSPDEYAPNVDKLTLDSPAPLRCDSAGKYPIPQPGLVTNREY